MRIHFNSQDLARTYLADGYDAMWELVNSLQALQGGYGRGTLSKSTASRLHRAAVT